jgi:hypothetical protein
MKTSTSSKLTLKFNKIRFMDFVNKIENISKIHEIIKIKINKDIILIYSTEGTDSGIVLATKNYAISTANYIDNFNENETFDFIIINSSRLIKNLKFYNDPDIQVKCDIIYKAHYDNDDTMMVRSMVFSDGKLKVSAVGGEDDKIRDINLSAIQKRTDINNCVCNFVVTKNDFMDVKKLASIDNPEGIVSFTIEEGRVFVGEDSKWEMDLCKINDKINSKIVFRKKYLNNINTETNKVEFFLFQTFVLVKDINSNLLISFEQTFDDE